MSVRIYIKLAAASFRSSVYTRFGFILQIISSIIQMLPSMMTMLFVVLRFGAVVHWELGDYMFIFIFANFSYGLRNLFFGSFRSIPRMIVSGELDSMLTKPVNTLLYISGRNFSYGALSYLILSVILLVYFADIFKVDWTISNIILYPLAVLSGAMVQGAITLIISCAAFYMMDSKSIDNLYSGFREFIWYPLDIFNGVIQAVMYTVVPLAYACFVPCGIFLQKSTYFRLFPRPLLILSLMIGPLLLALSYYLWISSVKRYVSSGA
jgi:ABC-2 type transport system permease protein